MGSKSVLLRTPVAVERTKNAGFGVPGFVCRSGAPRPMKMGTTRAPFHYDCGARHAFQQLNLRFPTILRHVSRAAAFMMWQDVPVLFERSDAGQCQRQQDTP